MHHRSSALLLLSLLAIGCAGDAGEQTADAAPAEVPALTADEAAIDQIRTAYIEHYNLHHADQVAALYADSAWVLSAEQAVLEGRAAVEADLVADFAISPTIDLVSKGTVVQGDHAVGLGEYSVTATVEGASTTTNGTYMTYFRRLEGQWKITGVITNYSGPPPAGIPAQPDGEEPPEDGTMKEFVASFTERFNASDWAGLAALYAADAKVAYSEAPIIEGTAAVQERFAAVYGTSSSPKIEIHDVGSMDLGGGWTLDGGWYTASATLADGNVVREGMYMHLMKQQADGSWKIHWAVTNGARKPAA